MIKIKFYGWTAGMKLIPFSKYLHEKTNIGLHISWKIGLRILDNETVFVDVDNIKLANEIILCSEELGVKATIEDNQHFKSIISLIDNDGEAVLQGMIGGAISGASNSILSIAFMGTAYIPKGINGRFDVDDKAFGVRRDFILYRQNNGLLGFFGYEMAIGRNLLVDASLDGQSDHHRLLAHERAHIYQQQLMGFANFYGRILYEYTINPGYSNDPYSNSN